MSAENASFLENESKVLVIGTAPAEGRAARSPAKSPRTRSKRKPRTWEGVGLVLPLLLLGAWDLVTRFNVVKPLFLPRPWSVVTSFYELLTEQALVNDFKVSALVVLQGFLLGSAVGVATGFLAGLSQTVERFLGPTLNSIRQIPPLAWLPLVVLWFGTGPVAKDIIIAKVVFFPVFLNTLQGIRGVSRDYIEVARVFEYSRARLLRRVILPAALPSIFVGLRYGAGLAWASVIAAEMLGGQVGLGYLLMHCQELLLIAEFFSIIAVIGLIGYLVDVGLRWVERGLLTWRTGFDG